MIGKRFSHFEITAKLGAGGMGEVWEAFDSKLERPVAVKVLPAEMADDDERLERFRREAKVIAALNHPNIVTIHAIEELDAQQLLVMERVDGETLDHRVPREGLPLDELLELAIPIADGLAAAHDKGIVHRDLKPGNVMVTPEGRVKLLDFGLAKRGLPSIDSTPEPTSDDDTTRMAPLTMEGTVMGTAPYMSPEQLQGRVVDARSDVFSLGIVLYEMATGSRPFGGESHLDLASSILKDTPRPVTDLRQELPRQLARIIESCLEKKPGDRFQSARDVRNQLAALQRETASGQAIRAPLATPGDRAQRGWIAAAVVVLAAVAGYLVWSSRDGRETAVVPADVALAAVSDGRLMLAVLPFENLGTPDDEYFTDGISEEIRSRLATIDGLGVISRTSARQYRDERPGIKQIGEELGVDYIVEGTVRWQPAGDGPRQARVTPQLIAVDRDVQMWTETYDAITENIFEVQSDIAIQVAERLDLELLDEHRQAIAKRGTSNAAAYDAYLRGDGLFARGKELESEDAVLDAIEHFETAIALDERFALAHARLAEASGYLYFYGMDPTDGRLAAARSAVDRALELDPQLPEAHYALAYALANEGDGRGAVAEFISVTKARPNYAEAYWTLSLFYVNTGAFDLANEMAVKATELNPRAGKHHCQVGGTNIGRGNYEQAISQHDRAIQLAPKRSCPYYCRIEAALSLGDLARARRYIEELPPDVSLEQDPAIGFYSVIIEMIDRRYEQGLERLDSTGSDEAYRASWHYRPKATFAAILHSLMGNEDLARDSYERARQHLEPLRDQAPGDTRFRSALALAYAGLGRNEDAIREIDVALEHTRGGGFTVPYIYREMAYARLLMGDIEGALDLLEHHLRFSRYLPPRHIEALPIWEPILDHPRFQKLMRAAEKSPQAPDVAP